MLRVLPLWLAAVLAALSGLALTASFPALGIWPLAFVAVFLLGWALLGRSPVTALFVGLVAGLTFWLTLINWLTLYLGPVPWLALGILQALFFAFAAAAMSVVLNRGAERWASSWGAYVLVPLLSSAVWVTRELITSNFPYGGFSWGLLSQSQSESPYASVSAWLGTYGLTFVIVTIAFAALQVVRRGPELKPLLAVAGLAFFLAFIPVPHVPSVGTMTVLAVQGNSKAGLFDDRTSGDILTDHVNGTLAFAGQHVDAVVWPENAADLNPLQVRYSAQVLDKVSTLLNAPIVTGAITRDSAGTYFNSSLVWQAGKGASAQFDKIHPVPFAEYMPDRPFWRALAPDLVDLVGYDYGQGSRPNVVDVSGVPVGLAICFDISYEDQARQAIADGAQIIFAQTNNADFGQTAENVQQLAIARLRAIETGRTVVNISTVGTSAIIGPTGSSLATVPPYQPGAMLTSVPLATSITPAMEWGKMYEVIIITIAVVGLLMLFVRRRKP